MAHVNPLVRLGIPRDILVHELARNGLGNILALAEANHRTFIKLYHPDRETGDAELMNMISEAIKELRNPDELQFYVEEIVGEEDVEVLRLQRQGQKLINRDNQALSHLASGMAHIDQFKALGIRGPTSFIASLVGQRIIIDVTSPSSAVARVTNLDTGARNVEGLYQIEVEYRRRTWYESYLDEAQQKRWASYADFGSISQVKLVGFVPYAPNRTKGSDVSTAASIMLDSPSRQFSLDWIVPEDCWFLSEMVFAPNVPEWTDGLVLFKEGRFAVTNNLLGTAAIN